MFPGDHGGKGFFGIKNTRLTETSVFFFIKKRFALLTKMFPGDHGGKGFFDLKKLRLTETSVFFFIKNNLHFWTNVSCYLTGKGFYHN